MINANLLRAKFVERGFTQGQIASALGIAQKTLSRKMSNGKFNLDEANQMIKLLKIENPARYFFANDVACQDTSGSGGEDR